MIDFNRYGSPSMSDIENFSNAYRERLDEAERAGTLPDNISLEVSFQSTVQSLTFVLTIRSLTLEEYCFMPLRMARSHPPAWRE